MKELSIYEKEFDINLGKINTFFEYALAFMLLSLLYIQKVSYMKVLLRLKRRLRKHLML